MSIAPRPYKTMEITVINDSQARLELDVREVKIMQHIFSEVKDVLNHEAEFETRVGGYYIETQELITSLSNNFIASLEEVSIINGILNEACNGIRINNFDLKIGISKAETECYLIAINKVMNELRIPEAYDGQCPRTTLSEAITAD
jgi:hypothetical protein